MIYELAIVAEADLGTEANKRFGDLVKEVLASTKSQLLIEDDWGEKRLAQPTSSGKTRGYFLYYMFTSNSATNNAEIDRRLGIAEGLVKFSIFKIGLDREAETLVKNFKTPFSKKFRGSLTDDLRNNDEGFDMEEQMADAKGGDRKQRFTKSRNCWFTANNITADWKDPATYSWLVNEFGKISPARVSGISRKHQRFVNSTIKRARQLGVIGIMNSRTIE